MSVRVTQQYQWWPVARARPILSPILRPLAEYTTDMLVTFLLSCFYDTVGKKNPFWQCLALEIFFSVE
jgi:hypothetical protein